MRAERFVSCFLYLIRRRTMPEQVFDKSNVLAAKDDMRRMYG